MTNTIVSEFWEETPQPGNPFKPAECHCAGYDVYGELVPMASLSEYILLLFLKQQPEKFQTDLFNSLSIALGNPGPRDQSVHAAMAAGAGGAGAAASLIAAISVGAGQFGGAREIATLMEAEHHCARDIEKWFVFLSHSIAPASGELDNYSDVWPRSEHPPGFDPHAIATGQTILQTLDHLESIHSGYQLSWLKNNRVALEDKMGMPISMTFVAAAGFVDIGLDEEQAELLFLLVRLPGAAAHGLEQRWRGWKDFPFYGDKLTVADMEN